MVLPSSPPAAAVAHHLFDSLFDFVLACSKRRIIFVSSNFIAYDNAVSPRNVCMLKSRLCDCRCLLIAYRLMLE